jgi:hypothetical protein
LARERVLEHLLKAQTILVEVLLGSLAILRFFWVITRNATYFLVGRVKI